MAEVQPRTTRALILHPDIDAKGPRREPSFALAEAVSLAHALPGLEVLLRREYGSTALFVAGPAEA